MKTLSKLIAAAFITSALFFSDSVKAQTTPANKFRVGIGVETADPLGNFRLGSTFILGGTIRVQYGISDKFAVTLTSGAYHFFAKYIPGTTQRYNSFGIIPVKVGVKEFFVPSFYVAGEIGEGFEETDSGAGPTHFIYSPGIGYANKHLDVSFRYESFSAKHGSDGLLGLRIAYGFAL